MGSTKTILIENRGGGYPIFSDFVGVQNNWLRKPVDVRFALESGRYARIDLNYRFVPKADVKQIRRNNFH
jgi:hypothetical protein